jgi:hypothetical protein
MATAALQTNTDGGDMTISDSPIATQINCGQCGAELPVEHGALYVTCNFCGTTSFVDKTRAVFHYALRVTVDEDAALAALRRWMAGNETIKGLDSKAQLESPAFEFFPMWMVRVAQGNEERVLLKPAAALSVSELEHLTVPAADLEPYHHDLDATAIHPSVPFETMRQWLGDDQNVAPDAIREAALVHVPIYTCKYSFGGRSYTAIVDAATARVFANIYPSKWEVPYRTVGAVAFGVYFIAAFIPLGGYVLNEAAGLATGVLVYGVVAAVVAVLIFASAAAVSARV